MPFGPSNLWALIERRSTPSASTSMSTYGAAWTASTWSRTPLWVADAPGDLGDRLDRADLVVGEHDRDEDRPVGDRRLELVGIDPAVAVDRQLDDLEAELLEVPQRVPDRVVLHGRRDDAVPARLAGPGGALEREVVRLGAARREDDLAGLGAEARRDADVRLVERRAGRAPVDMRRTRVPEGARQVRQHRVEDLAAERRRRRVVEVDRHGRDRTPGDRPGPMRGPGPRAGRATWPSPGTRSRTTSRRTARRPRSRRTR